MTVSVVNIILFLPRLLKIRIYSFTVSQTKKGMKHSHCVLCRFNETFRFLFWTMFGMANQEYVDMPQYVVAEFVGRVLYGIFTLIIVIVLLNMLIAMITNSFQKIEVKRFFLCHYCNKSKNERLALTSKHF